MCISTETKTVRVHSSLLTVGLLLAFFTAWLWSLGHPALTGDEAYVAVFVPKSVDAIFQQLSGDEPHPPLYYLAMHGWSLLFGMQPEFTVRLSSVFLGILLLSLMYRIGRDLGLGSYRALLPIVLVGFFPQVVLHLREAECIAPC